MVKSWIEMKPLLFDAAPRWLEYSLVVLAAWMIAGLWVADDMALPVASQQLVLKHESVGKDKAVDVASFKDIHLFGDMDEAEGANNVVSAPLVVQPSKLNIILVGTVVAGARSAAVVTMNGSKEQMVFFTGSEILPGVVLKSVEVMAIVLDNRGQQERISIEEGQAIVSPLRPTIRRPQAKPRARHINRSINRGQMQTQLRDFSKLLSQARVTPHFTNKKADGFTITEIVKGSLYEEIGLRNGDVIRKVNGESVVSAEQAMRMYRELQSATNIDVEIDRGGSIQQVSYSIQ